MKVSLLEYRCLHVVCKVRYVRSHYPDVDIPFEIFKDAMAEDETVTKGLERFDPYFGNILEYVRGQTGTVLAFAMGNTRNTLSESTSKFEKPKCTD